MPFAHMQFELDDLSFDTDPARLDLDLIHRFLSEDSYWVADISRADVVQAVGHSLNFGIYSAQQQLAFARVVTDTVGFAWLCDVFVVPAARGQGLGKKLLQFVHSHPQLQHLRRFLLATRDAHGLYQQHGFQALAQPGRYMEKLDPGAIQRRAGQSGPQ